MLSRLIELSLRQRALVLALAAMLLVWAASVVPRLPVDVLPNLTRPTVTILTEAPGLAPEEVELQVTAPIEYALNGTPGLERLRSNSDVGLSLVFVEFSYGTDTLTARQVVQERLQVAREEMPEEMQPLMLPSASLLGEIMLVGVWSENFGEPGATEPMDIRTIADTVIARRLLGIPGVSQVLNMGGGVKQYVVEPDPATLAAYEVSLEDLEAAVAGAVRNTPGGYVVGEQRELTIRNIGQTVSLDDIAATVIRTVDGAPVRISDVAEVRFGTQIMRGDSAVNGVPAVIMGVEKTPNANTLAVTARVEQALEDLKPSLPPDLRMGTVFRQAGFIERAVENLIEAVRDGAIMVVVVLVFFLFNVRTTLITLTAIPLSFALTAIVFTWLDMSINAMTLGGLAVALGMVVDDAIVDVENVFRRLRANRFKENPRPPLAVVADASKEVRGSILYATLLVIIVFIPLLGLESVEGRLFAPIAIATIVSLAASFLVSLTVVPALASFLLPSARLRSDRDTLPVRLLKRFDEKFLLGPALRHPWIVLSGAALLVAGAAGLWPLMGRQFLPPFNEGSFLVTMVAPPGTSLPRSREIGEIAERELSQIEEIAIFSRRTGRAEKAEHVMGVNVNEFDIELHPDVEDTEAVIAEVRQRLAKIPGVLVTPGQPIQHRIDHMLSGVQAQIALKIFGDDFRVLRDRAEALASLIRDIPGLADVNVEPQVMIPQIQIEPRRDLALASDIRAGSLNERLETLLGSRKLGEVREGTLTRDIVVWIPEELRDSEEKLRRLWVESESGIRYPLADVAEIRITEGPNVINREGTQRRIIVSANATTDDLGAVVDQIRARASDPETGLELPEGYYLTYEGQYRSQQEASKRLAVLGAITLVGMIFLVYSHFKSAALTAQVLLNIPLALIGGMALTWIMIGTVSTATLVGFITLGGIATRNTIMMISHYLHLMEREGEAFDLNMIVRGSLERLVPVSMTALSAGLALVPLALAASEPGKEILYPVAVAILGGLVSSTLLDMIVTPTVFFHFGRGAAAKWLAARRGESVLPANSAAAETAPLATA